MIQYEIGFVFVYHCRKRLIELSSLKFSSIDRFKKISCLSKSPYESHVDCQRALPGLK